jgi:hypothetical protein
MTWPRSVCVDWAPTGRLATANIINRPADLPNADGNRMTRSLADLLRLFAVKAPVTL